MGSALLNYPKSLICRINEVFVSAFFSIKYRYSDILLKKTINFIAVCFSCKYTCHCVTMASAMSASRYLTSASRYHPRYQSRSSMFIHGMFPRMFAELAEAVPIGAFE